MCVRACSSPAWCYSWLDSTPQPAQLRAAAVNEGGNPVLKSNWDQRPQVTMTKNRRSFPYPPAVIALPVPAPADLGAASSARADGKPSPEVSPIPPPILHNNRCSESVVVLMTGVHPLPASSFGPFRSLARDPDRDLCRLPPLPLFLLPTAPPSLEPIRCQPTQRREALCMFSYVFARI